MLRRTRSHRPRRRFGFGNREGIGVGGAIMIFIVVVLRCYGLYYRAQGDREQEEARQNEQQAQRMRQGENRPHGFGGGGHDAESSGHDDDGRGRRFGSGAEPQGSANEVLTLDDARGRLGLPSLDDVPRPEFPELANPRKYLVNGEHRFTWFDVELQPTDPTDPAPGQEMRLRVHVPASEEFVRRPLVLVPPAGTNLLQGSAIADGEPDNPEHLRYVEAGFVVVTFTLDGATPNDDPSTEEMSEAYKQFVAAHAGVVNARNALEYALERVVHVNPQQAFVAGHSSAGTLSLLFAAHEPRLAGCIAFAPVSNLYDDLAELRRHRDAPKVFPHLNAYTQSFAPLAVAPEINCPVFLFHAADDSRVAISDSLRLRSQLPSTPDRPVVFVRAESGDHYDSMVQAGLPAAIEWIKSRQSPSEPGAPEVAVVGPGEPAVAPPPEPENPRDRISPLVAVGPTAAATLRANMRDLSGTWRDRASRKIFLDIEERETPGGLAFHLVVRYAERLPNGRWRLDKKGNNVYSRAEAMLATNVLNQLVADVGGRTTLVLNSGLLVVQGPTLQGMFSRTRR